MKYLALILLLGLLMAMVLPVGAVEAEAAEGTTSATASATDPSEKPTVTQNAVRRDWIIPAVLGVLVILISVVVAIVQKFRYR